MFFQCSEWFLSFHNSKGDGSVACLIGRDNENAYCRSRMEMRLLVCHFPFCLSKLKTFATGIIEAPLPGPAADHPLL
jgi:hypothetical protein